MPVLWNAPHQRDSGGVSVGCGCGSLGTWLVVRVLSNARGQIGGWCRRVHGGYRRCTVKDKKLAARWVHWARWGTATGHCRRRVCAAFRSPATLASRCLASVSGLRVARHSRISDRPDPVSTVHVQGELKRKSPYVLRSQRFGTADGTRAACDPFRTGPEACSISASDSLSAAVPSTGNRCHFEVLLDRRPGRRVVVPDAVWRTPCLRPAPRSPFEALRPPSGGGTRPM